MATARKKNVQRERRATRPSSRYPGCSDPSLSRLSDDWTAVRLVTAEKTALLAASLRRAGWSVVSGSGEAYDTVLSTNAPRPEVDAILARNKGLQRAIARFGNGAASVAAPSTRRTATSHPSAPVVFRSKLYIERCPPGDDRWAAHLKVDYDSIDEETRHGNPIKMRRIAKFARRMRSFPGSTVSRDDVVDARVYATRRGHHLRVFLRPNLPRMPATTILAMQAALGDDERRQEMNAERVARDEPGWNVLWTRKYVNARLVGKEGIDEKLTAEVRRIFGVEGVSFHVDPTSGDDLGDGTRNRPLKKRKARP